jgi:hypothetical protein
MLVLNQSLEQGMQYNKCSEGLGFNCFQSPCNFLIEDYEIF